jgi:DNA-binding beta-propeller fold protein YncE
MFSLRICRLALSLSVLLCTSVSAQRKPLFTSPLPTGVRLDPAGEAVDLGSLPINLVLTPEKDRAVVVLSGWREQGVQVVDLKTRKVTQTLLQDGAFYGAAFSPDGHRLCVSGGNTDLLFVYAWKDGAATLENKFELAKAKTEDGTGTSYPAGLAFSPNGKFLYVVEDVGDRLAVVNAATGEITQRFSTDHYPYGVALTEDGQVFVSAWGGSTVSQFRVLADETLAYLARIEVSRHPSALAVRGTRLYVTLAGSDRVAVVDTKLRRVARDLHDAAPGARPRAAHPTPSYLPPMASVCW